MIQILCVNQPCLFLITVSMGKPLFSDFGNTFATVLIAFVVDAILYGIFAWYVSAVFPGKVIVKMLNEKLF